MSVARTYVVRSSAAGTRRRSDALTWERAITECCPANRSRRARSAVTATAAFVRGGPSTVTGTTTSARKAMVHSVTTTNPAQATAERARKIGFRCTPRCFATDGPDAAVELPHLSPSRATYQAATWERDLKPRRHRMRSTCDSADRSVIPRRAASSRFVRPSATNAATSVWRGVRPVGTERRSRGRPRKRRTRSTTASASPSAGKCDRPSQLDQLGARDRVSERPALGDRCRTVSPPVQHQRGRGDPRKGGCHVEVVGQAEEGDRRLGRGGGSLVLGQHPTGPGIRVRSEDVGEQVRSEPPVGGEQPEHMAPAVVVPDGGAGGPAAIEDELRDASRVVPRPTAQPPALPATSRTGRSSWRRDPRSPHGSWPARAPSSGVPHRDRRARSPGGRNAPASDPMREPRGTCARPGSTSRARGGSASPAPPPAADRCR